MRVYERRWELTYGKCGFLDDNGLGRRPLQLHAHAPHRNSSRRVAHLTGVENKDTQFEFLANEPYGFRKVRVVCDDNGDFRAFR